MGIYGTAADEIEEKGWTQHTYVDADGKICINEAIRRCSDGLCSLSAHAKVELADWLRRLGELGPKQSDGISYTISDLIDFNDREGMTKDYLVRILRKADEEL